MPNQFFVSVFTRLFKIAHKSLNGYFFKCNIFNIFIVTIILFLGVDLSCECDLSSQNGTCFI